MNYSQTTYRTGGGCKPNGINRPAYKYVPPTPEATEERRAKRQQEHEAWLLTPEGQAATERRLKQEVKQAEAAKKAEEIEAAKDAWAIKFAELKAYLVPGLIVTPRDTYTICLQQDRRRPDRISAYVLLRVEGEFPVDPYYDLGNHGRWGLKVFLDRASVDKLEAAANADNQNAFYWLRRDILAAEKAAELRRAVTDEASTSNVANRNFWGETSYDDYAYDRFTEEASAPVAHMTGNLPIRIIGVSTNGKAAQATLVEPTPASAASQVLSTQTTRLSELVIDPECQRNV